MRFKLGSLFDGIGGFPYAAEKHGFKAVWASEIEPFPIRVSQKHFAEMKHYGDISKVNGAELEPVDIISGGSPCQDLSVAGKPKSRKAIITWLKDPYSDSAAYKGIGNSIATVCAEYVFEGIAEVLRRDFTAKAD